MPAGLIARESETRLAIEVGLTDWIAASHCYRSWPVLPGLRNCGLEIGKLHNSLRAGYSVGKGLGALTQVQPIRNWTEV
jgi:hypothetical protein